MYIGNNFHVEFADNKVHTFEITGRERTANDSSSINYSDWTRNTVNIGDWQVIPFGPDNDLPLEIQETIFSNHLAPRILTKKQMLLWGQGPMLYEQETDGTNYIKKPVINDAIQDWLDSIDYETTLLSAIKDYYYVDGCFHKVFTDRGARIGAGSNIASIDPITATECRLCFKKSNKTKIPTHIMVADWSNGKAKEYKVYPLFDTKNQGIAPVTIAYSKFASFGVKFYSIPDLYGSMEWIKRSNAIPYVIKALTNNSLNIKWHITSPGKYWDAKEKILKDNAKNAGRVYKPQELEDLKTEILKKISDLLSGVDNVGKFWHNEKVIEIVGAKQIEHNWEIKPIEQKTKDFVESQIKIATHSDFATVAGLGLHSALANVGADGKSDSGSEQLYAHQTHKLTELDIPEMIVCKTFNQIIKQKFKTKIKLGFYHTTIQREEDKSPKNRMKNN